MPCDMHSKLTRQQCSIVCRFKFSKIERSEMRLQSPSSFVIAWLIFDCYFFDATFFLLCVTFKRIKSFCVNLHVQGPVQRNAQRISHSDHRHERVTYSLGSAMQNYPFSALFEKFMQKKEEEKINGNCRRRNSMKIYFKGVENNFIIFNLFLSL